MLEATVTSPQITPLKDAAWDRLPEIQDIKRVALNPGDIVVVTMTAEQPTDADRLEQLRWHLQRQFPENRVVLLRGLSIHAVMGPDTKSRIPCPVEPEDTSEGVR